MRDLLAESVNNSLTFVSSTRRFLTICHLKVTDERANTIMGLWKEESLLILRRQYVCHLEKRNAISDETAGTLSIKRKL